MVRRTVVFPLRLVPNTSMLHGVRGRGRPRAGPAARGGRPAPVGGTRRGHARPAWRGPRWSRPPGWPGARGRAEAPTAELHDLSRAIDHSFQNGRAGAADAAPAQSGTRGSVNVDRTTGVVANRGTDVRALELGDVAVHLEEGPPGLGPRDVRGVRARRSRPRLSASSLTRSAMRTPTLARMRSLITPAGRWVARTRRSPSDRPRAAMSTTPSTNSGISLASVANSSTTMTRSAGASVARARRSSVRSRAPRAQQLLAAPDLRVQGVHHPPGQVLVEVGDDSDAVRQVHGVLEERAALVVDQEEARPGPGGSSRPSEATKVCSSSHLPLPVVPPTSACEPDGSEIKLRPAPPAPSPRLAASWCKGARSQRWRMAAGETRSTIRSSSRDSVRHPAHPPRVGSVADRGQRGRHVQRIAALEPVWSELLPRTTALGHELGLPVVSHRDQMGSVGRDRAAVGAKPDDDHADVLAAQHGRETGGVGPESAVEEQDEDGLATEASALLPGRATISAESCRGPEQCVRRPLVVGHRAGEQPVVARRAAATGTSRRSQLQRTRPRSRHGTGCAARSPA